MPATAIAGQLASPGKPNCSFRPTSSVRLCDGARTHVNADGSLGSLGRNNRTVSTSFSETLPRLPPKRSGRSAAQRCSDPGNEAQMRGSWKKSTHYLFARTKVPDEQTRNPSAPGSPDISRCPNAAQAP